MVEFGSMLATLIPALKVIGMFIVLGVMSIVGLLVFIHFVKYDINVIILSKRAGGTLKMFPDKGAYIKDKDGIVSTFRLLKNRKARIVPPPYELLIPAKRGNFLILYQLNEEEFVPVDIDLKKVKVMAEDENGNATLMEVDLEPMPSDVKLWMASMFRQIKQTYGNESVWEKMLPIVTILIVGVLCILLVYFTVTNMGDFAASISQQAKAVSELASAVRSAGTTPY